MSNNRNGLAYFTESINNLMECPLILVDKHIAVLLKCVASTPAFTACLQSTLKTTSYVTEFSRARVTWTRPDGVTESKLKLPVERDRLFTFVTCLLTEIDSGRRNFLDFIKEYYYDNDTNISYGRFVGQVLKSYKRAGENILRSVDPDSLDLEAQERAEAFFAAERIYINSSALHEMLSSVENVRNLFETVLFSDEKSRLEAVTIANSMTNALQLKNPKILSLVWIGYKNTLSPYTPLVTEVKRLETMFAAEKII